MNRLIGALVFAFTSTASFAQNPTLDKSNIAVLPSTVSDTRDVQHVIDSYHQAVLTHDGARLSRLFLPEGTLWLNVLTDDAYARAKAKSPGALKVRLGSYTNFAQLVSSTKSSFDPKHTHLQINSDGTIASVYFEFSFLVDGKEQNHGSETWVLVKSTAGWRIAAITYSSAPTL